MRRPAETQLPQVGAVPFKVVECSSGLFSAHICSPDVLPGHVKLWGSR
jgi:hypothetical protein